MCCHHASEDGAAGQGCCGHCDGACHHGSAIEIDEGELAVLQRLAQTPFLPLARFLLAGSQGDHARAVALAPVHLTDPVEPLDRIRETGAVLLGLEEKGLLTLDYDQPLQGYDYGVYRTSAAFGQLTACAAEGARRPGFLFDRAELELGSIALTALGRQVLDQLPAPAAEDVR